MPDYLSWGNLKKTSTMKPHVKIYMDYFGYGIDDIIPCEVCQCKAVDVHHIKSRGMGGTSKPDVIENLMALCRACHIKYGDIKIHLEYLHLCHTDKLNAVKK